MAAALPMLVLVLALLVGVPIAVALAGSGMLGIYLVTGDFGKVMGIVSLAPFSTVADYALTTIPMFILMAFFSALERARARPLYRRRQLVLAHPRRAGDRHRVRLRHFRCDVRRQHGRGVGHVQDRHARDAPPRLFRRAGGGRDRHPR